MLRILYYLPVLPLVDSVVQVCYLRRLNFANVLVTVITER